MACVDSQLATHGGDIRCHPEFQTVLQCQHADIFSDDGDISPDKLAAWLLEEQPRSGRALLPWALRAWTAMALQQASSCETSPHRAAKSQDQGAQAALVRAIAPTTEADTRVWALRAASAFKTPWALAALIGVFALDAEAPCCSEKELMEVIAAALQTLPWSVLEGGLGQSWEQTVAREALAAVSVVASETALRKDAVLCFGKLCGMCSSPEWFICEVETASRCMEQMLRGDLGYLDACLRRQTAEAVRSLLTNGGEAVTDWMLVCLSSPLGLLSSASPKLRIVGVFLLELLATDIQNPECCKLLSSLLCDADPEVCGMATEALMRVGARLSGAGTMLSSLQPLLSNEMPHVRAAAVEVAVSITEGKELSVDETVHVGDFAVAMLQVMGPLDPDGIQLIRTQALKLLMRVQEFAPAVQPVLSLAEGCDGDICEKACCALGVVSPQGNEAAVAAFSWVLERSTDAKVKCACLHGLGVVAPVGHEGARALALQSMADCTELVCRSAMKALGRLCFSSDDEAVTALTKRVACEARALSAGDLAAVLCPIQHDNALFMALCDTLGKDGYNFKNTTDSHWTVRRAILLALASSAPRGCKDTLPLVQLCLKDKNADVCQTAVETLFLLSEPGDASLTKLLTDIREDQEVQVQEAIDNGLEAFQKAFSTEARSMDKQTCAYPHPINVANMTVEKMLTVYDDIVEQDMALEVAGEIRSTGLSSLSDSVADESSSNDDEDETSMEKVSAAYKQLTALHDALDIHFGSASSTSVSSNESISSEEEVECLVNSPIAIVDDVPTMPMEDLLLFYDRTVAKEEALTDAAELLSEALEPLSSPADFELVPDDAMLEFKPPVRSKVLPTPAPATNFETMSQHDSEDSAAADVPSDEGSSSQADRSWVLI